MVRNGNDLTFGQEGGGREQQLHFNNCPTIEASMLFFTLDAKIISYTSSQ